MATQIRAVDRTRHRRLEQLLSQQNSILQSRRQAFRAGLPSEASGVLDDAEHSLDAEEQSVGLSVLALTSLRVQDIESALHRLDAGEFGACSECLGAISDQRLRALPFAGLCLACQGRHDSAPPPRGLAPRHWPGRSGSH